jgi:hypothetical protein
MRTVFLASRLPLTKTFLWNAGVLTATPYPHVSRLSSYHEEANTLSEFLALLRTHAAQGHCLFGGQLIAPLAQESRAGKTAKSLKEWVVFDFDKVEAKDAADVVARYLPADCQQVSYIAQLSASMFRPDVSLWSGHIYMLLKTPMEEARIKQWVEALNFSNPALEQQIRLSDSLQALHWPLDRTAVYNSKLIYIAPPKCHGFTPIIGDAFTLVKKRLTHLVVPNFVPIDSVTVRQKINALRRTAGLDDIDYATTPFEGEEVLLKSGMCEISGIRTSGDHYIRFNLNGGDSYAYFIDLRNPALIRNFKGEPLLKTEDAAPDLWKALRAKAPQIVAKAALDEGTEVLAFYATNQSSAVKVGTYSPVNRKLTLNNASETSARAWQSEYGLVQKGFLPHMDLVFDPRSDVQYMHGTTSINTFRATDYMARARTSAVPATLADTPPLINRLIRSMLGDPDDKLLLHFINWLAFIFQTRQKTGTAWLLHGRTGTGKGSFIKHILMPLFGNENVRVIQLPQVSSQFNAFLESALFVIVEESEADGVENPTEVMSKVRHWITEDDIEINQKGVKTYQAKTFCNFLFTANSRKPITITADDRRFNIPSRQENQIHFTPNELITLEQRSELDSFAAMLQRWPVNAMAVHHIIEPEARADVHEATTGINQLIAEAIIAGHLQFFVDRMPSEAESQSDFHNRFNPIGLYKPLLDKYISMATDGLACIIPEEELFCLFRTLIPDTRFFQDSKTWRKRHYKSLGLDVDRQHRLPGNGAVRARGVLVEWRLPERIPAKADATNVTPMRKRGAK